MLTMTDINTIKNLRNNHDKSINHISKELNINWRTAKKYADEDQLPTEKIYKRTGMMYQDGWGEYVCLWLSEDSRLAKKKRRSNLRYFVELQELGFKGSYRTVCQFIKDWRSTHTELQYDLGFERLEHPPGEAQLDFGTMEVEHEGAFKDIKVLVLTAPYSNAGFAVALPAENQECLLEGMKMLFTQMGGIPRTIRIDNMTTAVKESKTKFEDAQLNDIFLRFATHYGFDVQVCNPRSGNEKGSVENKVGYVRYNFFPAAPKMVSFEQLNQELAKQLRKDMDRLHYDKNCLIEELWIEEQRELLALPDVEYPVFKDIAVKANKYNEIKLDNTRIHIPRSRNHTELYARLTWSHFKIVSLNGEILCKELRPYMNKSRPIPWTNIFVDWKRSLSKISYSRYWKYLPHRIQYFLNIDNKRLIYERLDMMIRLLVTHEMSYINEHFYEFTETIENADFGVEWSEYDSLTSKKKGAA
ncbi:IS21 family transposase [Enterococcus sp. AZ196]|uniref:IS21 family transposase n=1 Tax=Enterococcus sp. AZ196 TaxID=2774659 RepID=UPI003D2A713F